MQQHNCSDLEIVLRAADSPRKYQPEDLNVLEEYERARSLGRVLAKVMEADVEVEDPSLFQDGSILTRLLFDQYDDKPNGQVVLSSFGRLATVCGVRDEERASAIESALSSQGYMYVPFEELNYLYTGHHAMFSKLTWQERFFSSFYDPLYFRAL